MISETKINQTARQIETAAADLLVATTWERTERQFAGVGETLAHIATLDKNSIIAVWRLANGKFLDEDVLKSLAGEGLINYVAANPSMNLFSSPTFYKAY